MGHAASISKSSINVKTLGNPAKIVGDDDVKVGDKVLLGTILGVANGAVKRADPKDPERFFEGVKGSFEAVPTDPNKEAIGAGTLFAPDHIHNGIINQLKQNAKAVSFAFEVYVVKGGTAGFTWEYRFLSDGEPAEDDPLLDVRKLLDKSSSNVAKLEAPHKAKAK